MFLDGTAFIYYLVSSMKLYQFYYLSKNERGTYQCVAACDSLETFRENLLKWNLTVHWDYWETPEQMELNSNPKEVKYDLPFENDFRKERSAWYLDNGSIKHIAICQRINIKVTFMNGSWMKTEFNGNILDAYSTFLNKEIELAGRKPSRCIQVEEI